MSQSPFTDITNMQPPLTLPMVGEVGEQPPSGEPLPLQLLPLPPTVKRWEVPINSNRISGPISFSDISYSPFMDRTMSFGYVSPTTNIDNISDEMEMDDPQPFLLDISGIHPIGDAGDQENLSLDTAPASSKIHLPITSIDEFVPKKYSAAKSRSEASYDRHALELVSDY